MNLFLLANTKFDVDGCSQIASVIGIAGFVLKVIQFVVPILLILWGTIDLVKSVVAGKEDDIKKNQKILIRRIIMAVLVFMVPILVSTVLGLIGSKSWQKCWTEHKDDGIINVENQNVN